MSAQMCDRIRCCGGEYYLAATPLEDYFVLHPDLRPSFQGFHTGCVRGYIGEWAVHGSELYLTGLRMVLSTDATFGTLFPDAGAKGVFADWVSGDLKCPHGKIVKSVHAGFASIWEEELHLFFENGILLRAEERRNDVTESGDAGGGRAACSV